MMKKQAFYGDDLAYIHDVGYAGFANGCAPGLLDILRKAGIESGTVVDIGCGSGVWCKRLVAAGYDVSGVDLSASMVAIARRHVPEAEFHIGSLWKHQFAACRAVTALGEVFCYRPTGKSSVQNLETVFQKLFKCLEPGGLFIFDVAEVGLDRNRKPTFAEGTDWACLVRFSYDEGKKSFGAIYRIFPKSRGASIGDPLSGTSLQLYRRDAVAETLRKVGFRVRMVRRFGTYPLLPGRVGFIARKP